MNAAGEVTDAALPKTPKTRAPSAGAAVRGRSRGAGGGRGVRGGSGRQGGDSLHGADGGPVGRRSRGEVGPRCVAQFRILRGADPVLWRGTAERTMYCGVASRRSRVRVNDGMGKRQVRDFNATDFITRLGHSLVDEFQEARQATTSQLIGDAIETPVRRRLEQVLPRGIAVGSGCVIDSYGNCSRQQDVVLYERDICPIFSINNTPQSTYYPCEGVMAVIEVKSAVASAELRDSFEKIASVKRLRRFDVYSPGPGEAFLEHRRYEGTQMANVVRFSDAREMEQRGLNQIMGAILTGNLRMNSDTFRARFVELVRSVGDEYSPNLVEILDGGTLIPCIMEKGKYRPNSPPRELPTSSTRNQIQCKTLYISSTLLTGMALRARLRPLIAT